MENYMLLIKERVSNKMLESIFEETVDCVKAFLRAEFPEKSNAELDTMIQQALQKAILKIEKKDTVCVPSSMMTREEFLGLSSESFDEEIPTYRERKEESALHKAGYSVGQDSTLSTHQRQDLLANLIKTGQFKKSYILQGLSIF